jgi:hypothetical protein
MPTFNTESIRIFKDDSSKTVETALTTTFYGVGAVGQDEANGYPSDNLSNLPFTLANYEITVPVTLSQTAAITSGTKIVDTTGTPFTSGDVGKFLWDATDATALKLIGKIATFTDTNTVVLEDNYLGTTLTVAPCYISSSTNNNVNFNTSGEFLILVKVGAGSTLDFKRIPNTSVTSGFPGTSGGLNVTPALNSEYNVNGSLNNAYVSLKRISVKGTKGTPVSAVDVPAIITRINSYVVDGVDTFRFTSDIPLWVAYKINPFGSNSVNFSKNTVYSLEVNETLPFYTEVSAYSKTASAAAGHF